MATYRFDDFALDAHERTLRRAGEVVPLQDLPLRLLIALVERAPRLATRDELREELWPPGTHLDVDASLNTAVARVREALGDEAGDPRFLVTVPRRGYRFAARVRRVEKRAGVPARRWWWAAALAVLIPILIWITLRGDVAEQHSELPGGLVSDETAAVREQLLIGRHYADRRSREGLEKSIAAFQSALALDADNAEAYSGLAASYTLLGIYDYWRPREAFGPAETMARRALELDPESAQAHLAMGLVAAVSSWDWSASLRSVDRALELAPASAEARYWRGALLSALGRHDEAIASSREALELEPTSAVFNTALAWQLFKARRGAEAVEQAHRAIELFPGYYDAWDNLKWIQVTLGNEAEAVEAWIRAEELDSGKGEGVRQAYEAGGLEGLHRESIKAALARWESGRYQAPYDVVLDYAALGEVEEAMPWLERSFAERETDLVELAVDPRLDALRGRERFGELLCRMGLGTDPCGDAQVSSRSSKTDPATIQLATRNSQLATHPRIDLQPPRPLAFQGCALVIRAPPVEN